MKSPRHISQLYVCFFFMAPIVGAGGMGMAGGMAVLGGLVAGPALLVFGAMFGLNGMKGLEQAKKRDHKVFVTREAIHRVDYVDIF